MTNTGVTPIRGMSTWSCTEMQKLRPHPDLLNGTLPFNKISRCILKVKKHYFQTLLIFNLGQY